MRYEVFEKIITNIKACSEKDLAIYKMGIDLTSIVDEYSKTINLLLNTYYSKEGVEWIDWFLYERESHTGEILKAYDENDNEICRTIEELWTIIEEIRCSVCFKEYELTPEMTDEQNSELLKELFKK